jgi:hypothetical protein
MRVVIDDYDYNSYEAITVGSTAVGFTASKITPTTGDWKNQDCQVAEFRVETDQIRYRLDGADPTSVAGSGTLVNVGDIVTIRGTNNIKRFRAIRVTADATITVHYGW